MRRTASEVLRDLEIRVASLERQSLGQRMEENPRDSDKNVLFVADSLNDLLKKKGLHTDLVAERGQGVSILIDNSLGDAMEKLQGIRFGVKWFGDDKLYHLGLMWILSENIDGDIYLTRAESRWQAGDLLIEYALDNIAQQFVMKGGHLTLNKPIPIVVGGGTSLAGGFMEFFQEVFETKRKRFPIDISEVRHASDPFHAVSKGMLVLAQQEYDEEWYL